MLRRLLAPVLLLPLLSGCGGEEPAATATSTATPDGTQAVIQAVSSVAPALETAFRGNAYPQSLEEVESRMSETAITLPAGITFGSYVYDADAVEFTLCLQDGVGAWASYDTAPMGVRESGTSGGCP